MEEFNIMNLLTGVYLHVVGMTNHHRNVPNSLIHHIVSFVTSASTSFIATTAAGVAQVMLDVTNSSDEWLGWSEASSLAGVYWTVHNGSNSSFNG